ncbi:uncharacterized protein LOC116247363 [Nymphaea colorata]|nr:uncharacterized protein LOC116247363 [Nymphaea colorata]XP_031475383.1 uncharacterized protein LOC116247363 [Nymphaea colorata]XP_031475384.1 uncharacterized protein LOC116247363 [Nymphaea colorata]XP_031475385.1 uncharacterized protein LOC116247363 [Nymphaea colorata]
MDSDVEDIRNKGTMERKRCLPPWMLGITAAGKEKTSMIAAGDDINVSVGDEQLQQVEQSEHVSGGTKKNLVLPPVKDANGNTVKRIRKSSKRIIENENVVQQHEDVHERKKKRESVITGEENNAQNLKRRSKTYGCSGLDSSARLPSSQSCSSDVELSLDDLVTIAEEYVREEAEKDGEKEAGNGLPSKSSSSQLISRHVTKSEAGHIGMDFIKKRSIVNDGLPIENMQCTAPVITGNAAEDMLNIFLGPAVWKPREHKKLELAEYILQSHKLSENLNKGTVEGEEAPVMKKKGSLKEKIAMFLD